MYQEIFLERVFDYLATFEGNIASPVLVPPGNPTIGVGIDLVTANPAVKNMVLIAMGFNTVVVGMTQPPFANAPEWQIKEYNFLTNIRAQMVTHWSPAIMNEVMKARKIAIDAVLA